MVDDLLPKSIVKTKTANNKEHNQKPIYLLIHPLSDFKWSVLYPLKTFYFRVVCKSDVGAF